MKYRHILDATFLERPNRFIAIAELKSSEKKSDSTTVPILNNQLDHSQVPEHNLSVVCHVKNTGRCRELLVPGASVLLEYHPDAVKKGRKTEYSLIGVYKEKAGAHSKTVLINMDSQAPNKAAWEWLQRGGFGSVSEIQREVQFCNSRFDLSFKKNGLTCFMEVKGVTLENKGFSSFPDAPTERGLKHLLELKEAVNAGYGAYVLFVIQMKEIHSFTPNRATHPAFAEALRDVRDAGVNILARDCLVTRDSMIIDSEIPVLL